MKILVLGAGGMAGHTIAIRLLELGHHVIGLARRKLDFCDCCISDLRDSESLKNLIDRENFDAIVNAVGALPKDINFNPANGIWINAYLPHLLAEFTRKTNTKIIHLSTDCVFSGHNNGNYKENELPLAIDYYGRSKLLGELNDCKNLTFRMSIVGPDINETGIGLFNWFMNQEGSVCGYSKAIWTGVSTITLANAIHLALKQNINGLYQLVNNETITKYKLLQLFNALRSMPIEINADPSYCIDKSLVCTRDDFDFIVPTYASMVESMGEWICKHAKYYPHYKGKVKV